MIRYEMIFGIPGRDTNTILASVVMDENVGLSRVGQYEWHLQRYAVQCQVAACLRNIYGPEAGLLLQREVYVPEVSDV